jgi:hypothetical protein
MTNDMKPATLIAADSGQAIGWLIVVVAACIERYGWMLGVICWIGAFFFRHARHAISGLILVLLFSAGMLLITASLGLKAALWNKRNEVMPPPPIETRKAL